MHAKYFLDRQGNLPSCGLQSLEESIGRRSLGTLGQGRRVELVEFVSLLLDRPQRPTDDELSILPVAFIEHRLNRSVPYLPSGAVSFSNGSFLGSSLASRKEGTMKMRRGKERGRKSGKREYHVYAVLPEGGREGRKEGGRRNIIALFRPDASPTKGGRNKYREERTKGGG